MAKHIVKMECKEPGCKHPHDIEVDLPEAKTIPGTMQTIPQIQQIPQPQVLIPPQEPPKPESKKLSHEEMSELMPKGLNFMSCPGGDCGHQKIKNPKQTKKYKTCPNGKCGANTVPKGSDYCPTCGKGIDEDSDLDDGVTFEDEEDE